jgi:hypothetical protein
MNLDDEIVNNFTQTADATIAELAQEVVRLRAAIREHQSKRGHDLCWINDLALWKTIDEDAQYPHDSLPVHDEFLAGCELYYQSRLTGTSFENPVIIKKVVDN